MVTVAQPQELFDRDAEDAIVAAMLVHPEWADEAMRECPPSYLFTTFARETYKAILAVNARGQFDLREVAKALINGEHGKALGTQEQVLGYLRDAIVAYPGGDPGFWCRSALRVVRTDYMRRQVIEAASEAKSKAERGRWNRADLLGVFEDVMRVMEDDATGVTSRQATDALRELSAMRASGGEPRISTGYGGLDIAGAFVEAGLYVIAARTGEGKSSLTANMATRLCKAGVPFGLVTVEMTRQQMTNSMLGIEAGIDRGRLARNKITDAEQAVVAEAEQALAGAWWIYDREGVTVEDIAAQARAWVRRHGIKVLLVDHLQRIKATDSDEPRHLQIGHITWALKGLARQLGIVVVLAVQINREGAREGAPKLHHLKESGSVEEDADGVIAIYVDRTKNDLSATVWDAELWWLKNRHGALGTCKVRFDKASGRITELDTTTTAREHFAHTRKDFQ